MSMASKAVSVNVRVVMFLLGSIRLPSKFNFEASMTHDVSNMQQGCE